MIEKLKSANFGILTLIIVILLVVYYVIYTRLNYETIEDAEFFIDFLISYLFSNILVRFASILIKKDEEISDINILPIPQTIFIIVVFLLVSSLFVSPMSFLIVITPIKRNIVLHLFILTLISHALLKRTRNK
jgi:hypothetical protein